MKPACRVPARPVPRSVALPAALLVGLAALLGGCGEEPQQPGARLRVFSSPEDGPFQGTLRLHGLRGRGAPVYEARRLSASESDVWIAPDAPDDHYRVSTTAGWGMIWIAVPGAPAPLLRGASHPPSPVRLGRPRSLYLGPADEREGRPGKEWGADWRPPGAARDAPRVRIPIETQTHADGTVALRFRAAHWQPGAQLRVLGHLQGGVVSHLLVLTLPAREHPDLPHVGLVRAATHAPLTVHLVPPPGRSVARDGTPVAVQLLGMPLDVVYDGRAVAGRVELGRVGLLGGGLRITLPEAGGRVAFDLTDEAWRLRGGAHVVALDPETASPVELVGDPAAAEVRALFPDGKAFGRLPLDVAPDGPMRVLAPPGPQDWCVRLRDGRWVFLAFDVPGAPGALVRLTLPGPAVKGCRVRGAVRGGGVAHRVVFHLELPAVDAEGATPARPARSVAGAGFEAAVSPQGEYEASVPPGAYAIRVHGPGGALGAPRQMVLRSGMQLRMDLDAR